MSGIIFGMRLPISRRAFLKSSAYGIALGLTGGSLRRFPNQTTSRYDLDNDVVRLDSLPPDFAERASSGEQFGPLSEAYYAVHVSLVNLSPGRPPQDENELADQERFTRLAEELNHWVADRLGGRRLRFIYHGPVPPRSKGPQPDRDRRGQISRLLQAGSFAPAAGGPQRIQILLVRGFPSLAWATLRTVMLGWPTDTAESDTMALVAPLAHLLGHALGLSHPRPDIDTQNTEWASDFSFMHPGVADRGLSDSLILDSPLNPEKARLVRSGFFPREGVVHTLQTGGIPLEPGILIAGSGQEIRVAHGNYVLPCQAGEAAVTVRGADLTVDLGSALIRGDAADFAAFGEHPTHGTGIRLDGTGGNRITLRGGIITGYHYGVKGDGLRGGAIEGVTVVNNRRLQSDARRELGDRMRGLWLDFWATPEEDATEGWTGALETEDLAVTMGAGIVLASCHETTCRGTIATHNTVGIADFYGQSNRYEGNDLGGCPIGLRFWQAHGSQSQPITVARNVFRFNTQPDPWWWSHGDSGAIVGVGLRGCVVQENEIAFGGDGVFLSGFPRLPGQTQAIVIQGNHISHCYAHGIELDFAQACIVEDNRIADNWLSGVWAGHTAGILIVRNAFTGNNRGRMFGGWSNSQGAVSCPQGRAVVVGNTFEDNWVAINLLQDDQPALWLFSGDAAQHIVTGNTCLNNRIGVRLGGVRASEVTGNLMRGNTEDLAGDISDNRVDNNGPAVDPRDYQALFFPVQRLLFDPGLRSTRFQILRVAGDKAAVLPPDEVVVQCADSSAWLEASVAPDGTIHLAANPAGQGFHAAVVTVMAGGKQWHVPAKMMYGDFQVTVTHGDPTDSTSEALGSTPIGPAAIFGLFPVLSDVLRSEWPTSVTGAEPFGCDFVQPEFRGPGSLTKAVAIVLSDGVTALALAEDGPIFSPEPPGEDQYWVWATETLNLNGPPTICRFRYTHGPELAEKGMPACAVLWLYPLDDEDSARLPADAAHNAATQPSAAYIFSMPGARRAWLPH